MINATIRRNNKVCHQKGESEGNNVRQAKTCRFLPKLLKQLRLRKKPTTLVVLDKPPVPCVYSEIATEIREDGNRLGDYVLLEQIAKGGHGSVYSAASVNGDSEVVIKKMDITKMRPGGTTIRMAKQEAELMRDNGYQQNIVHLVDAMHSDKALYHVMPRATTDLNRLMQPVRQANFVGIHQPNFQQQILRGILFGLKHLHKRGVAHLDIKAENILLFTPALDNNNKLRRGHRIESSCIKLADFGVSRVSPMYGKASDSGKEMPREHVVSVRSKVGTTRWCAPEVLLGTCVDGRLADVWSFGCIVMYLCGFSLTAFVEASNLIEDNDLEGYLKCLQNLEDRMAFEEIPGPLDKMYFNLASRCLRVDPSKRITAAKALNHPLFKFKFPEEWSNKAKLLEEARGSNPSGRSDNQTSPKAPKVLSFLAHLFENL